MCDSCRAMEAAQEYMDTRQAQAMSWAREIQREKDYERRLEAEQDARLERQRERDDDE